MESQTPDRDLESLATQVTTLEELLAVQERIVGEQAAKLEDAMRQLDERIVELEHTKAELLRYSEDLAHANEEVKQFAYIVSHDLRSPLVNLKGFASELHAALKELEPIAQRVEPLLDAEDARTIKEVLGEDMPEAVQFIESSATRMDGFISALLQLSRLGRRELSLEPIEVASIVREVVDGLQHQIDENGMAVSVGELPAVTADRTALEQIFGNVISNAVKYADPERPCKIEITGERNNGSAIFRIADSGRGIAEEDMPKVFAPFRRAGSGDVPGEGMGLAYVNTMVRRHGGRISCESEFGSGTTFTITMPVDPEGGKQ